MGSRRAEYRGAGPRAASETLADDPQPAPTHDSAKLSSSRPVTRSNTAPPSAESAKRARASRARVKSAPGSQEQRKLAPSSRAPPRSARAREQKASRAPARLAWPRAARASDTAASRP